jgi:hypothetical protein
MSDGKTLIMVDASDVEQWIGTNLSQNEWERLKERCWNSWKDDDDKQYLLNAIRNAVECVWDDMVEEEQKSGIRCVEKIEKKEVPAVVIPNREAPPQEEEAKKGLYSQMKDTHWVKYQESPNAPVKSMRLRDFLAEEDTFEPEPRKLPGGFYGYLRKPVEEKKYYLCLERGCPQAVEHNWCEAHLTEGRSQNRSYPLKKPEAASGSLLGIDEKRWLSTLM